MNGFGWAAIVRLGLVQAALGAVVVLTTSTLNRVLVVEHALPALLPGLLVGLHHVLQLARPRMGHGTDQGGRSTPWIVGGMAVLATGGVLAAAATAWMASDRASGVALAFAGYALVGLGVSAAGTALLVLLAKRVAPARRGPAATVVWMMMIAGFAVTAGTAGRLLDPYSPDRLLLVSASVSVIALVVTILAIRGVEGAGPTHDVHASRPGLQPRAGFRIALDAVWREPVARQFTVFVAVSMLAYSAQDLILEPFAGVVFGYSPAASTQLAGLQHGGVLAGMLLATTRRGADSLRWWAVGGCVASAAALLALSAAGWWGPGWPLSATVFVLGMANGAFSIGAIGSMMRLADQGAEGREGLRMGLWGASQALAFAVGGLAGAAASDLAHLFIADSGHAYGIVFALEAALFLVAGAMAWRIGVPAGARPATAPLVPWTGRQA